jgi:hypothetical protein
MNTPDRPICSQAAARAAGLDVAPTPVELTAMAESIVRTWGDRWAEPDDLAASTADAGAQLARAVPLILAALAARPARAEAPAEADFYRPGHTYTAPEYGWKFRCDTVTTHPEDSELTALGWRFFHGEWEPYAYHEDDWDIAKFDGTATTGGVA